MKITYDPKYNISYIKFRDSTEEVETIKISDEVNIDISPDGKIYSIELLNANEQMKILNDKLTIVGENSGKEISIAI
ncbi:Protein of unknown function DUF2283 [Thermodesulfobium narugense DSM 14796]|uniref:DUF2283 domain-containing protein n=1 Tax=Thermodesulfobium narugense DSM 14796 TaxID=747365 RepID=M1E551_9BACT|nr:DUF2283 domain-containing protein [Thermodesulfobium narugense]AEE14031.1 Protein of unknown function DUF2283 [Thermodesulfobium narugense DSM 14796]